MLARRLALLRSTLGGTYRLSGSGNRRRRLSHSADSFPPKSTTNAVGRRSVPSPAWPSVAVKCWSWTAGSTSWPLTVESADADVMDSWEVLADSLLEIGDKDVTFVVETVTADS